MNDDDGPLSWMARGACVGHPDPDIFFPGKPSDDDSNRGAPSRRRTVEAEQICARCPVQRQCGEYTKRFGGVHGIWGGETHYSKNAVGMSGAGPQLRDGHGTAAMAARHRRKPEKPCRACLMAENSARAARGWT